MGGCGRRRLQRGWATGRCVVSVARSADVSIGMRMTRPANPRHAKPIVFGNEDNPGHTVWHKNDVHGDRGAMVRCITEDIYQPRVQVTFESTHH